MHPKIKVPVVVLVVLSILIAVAIAVGVAIPVLLPITGFVAAVLTAGFGSLAPKEKVAGLAPVLKVKVPAQILTLLTIVSGVLVVAGSSLPAVVPYTALAATIIQITLGYFSPSN